MVMSKKMQQSKGSKNHSLYYGIATEFCRCNNKSFVFGNSETETLFGKLYSPFSDNTSCSTRVDVLETGNVPILFSLPQMKNMGTTIELDPKGENILHVRLLACTLLQLNTILWDTLFRT